MYIDETNVQGHQLLCDMQDRLDRLMKLDLIEKLKPTLYKDGNQFCYLYGTLPNDCVLGFGETVEKAMCDFWMNFHNEKAVTIKRS